MPNTQPSSRRNPAQTRERLLNAAFEEIYHTGYQGSDIGAIIARAGVTKGALYHHFDSKEALGHAVIEDVIGTITQAKWLSPLEGCTDPIPVLKTIVEGTYLHEGAVFGGCPLNNLAQEMSPVDEGFRQRLANIFQLWIDSVAAALRRGQEAGQVRSDIHPQETATYFIATYEGYMSLAKNAQSADILKGGISQMTRYLDTLRAGRSQ